MLSNSFFQALACSTYVHIIEVARIPIIPKICSKNEKYYSKIAKFLDASFLNFTVYCLTMKAEFLRKKTCSVSLSTKRRKLTGLTAAFSTSKLATKTENLLISLIGF